MLAGCPGCLPAHASLLSPHTARHKERFKNPIPLPALPSSLLSCPLLVPGQPSCHDTPALAGISTQKAQAVPSLTWRDMAWPISHRWFPHATFVCCALPTLQKARAASTCHPHGGRAVREKNHLPSVSRVHTTPFLMLPMGPCKRHGASKRHCLHSQSCEAGGRGQVKKPGCARHLSRAPETNATHTQRESG